MTVWKWEVPVTRHPEATLVVFSRGELTEEPLSLGRHGVPGVTALRAVEVRRFPREQSPEWFDGWRQGALRNIAASDLGDDLSALDAAAVLHVVAARPSAPSDLGYLQAIWGIARWMGERGAEVVLDVHAHRFRRTRELPGPEAAFDVRREIQVLYETDSSRPDMARALHTRGLKKFGAPDLIALCHDEDAPIVGEVVAELAARVAGGLDLAAPRHALQVAPGETWWAVGDPENLADMVQLNNAARVLVDAQGRHLVGTGPRWAARATVH